MKKVALCALLIWILIFSGCREPLEYCKVCGSECDDNDMFYGSITFCRGCMEDDLSTCRNCGVFYPVDLSCTSEHHCWDCVEEFSTWCCMCGAGYFDYPDLVEICVGAKKHYMCAECTTKYLMDIALDKPFSCCNLH